MLKQHIETVNGYKFQMIPIEGGTFNMGDEHEDLWAPCRPVHEVNLSNYSIGKFPVTQGLWKAVMNGETPSFFQGDDLPVEQVSWDDINTKFLPSLRKLTKLHYRLPTEAEWEYAARGGKYHDDGFKYAGSDRLKDVGWFTENSSNETKPVGLKQSNQLGIYDMSGNVYEWCEDWFDEHYYEECKQQGIVQNPGGSQKGTGRVIRGGDEGSALRTCRITYRHDGQLATRALNAGFRLVLSLQADDSPTPAFL